MATVRSVSPYFAECVDCGERRILKSTPAAARCMSCANARSQRERGNSPPKKVNCKSCNREFVSAATRRAKFCSNKCQGEWMQKTRKGKANPNYRHGKRKGTHLSGWNVSVKGETVCRVCGGTNRLALHHAIPRGKWQGGREDLRNGIALCVHCHTSWHRGARKVYRDMFTDEEWEFMSSATLTGESTDDWLARHYPERFASEA